MDHDATACAWALWESNVDILDMLMKHGGRRLIDDIVDDRGHTLLMHALMSSDVVPCMEMLLSYGADIEVKNYDGRTVRDLAVEENMPDIVVMLDEERRKRRGELIDNVSASIAIYEDRFTSRQKKICR